MDHGKLYSESVAVFYFYLTFSEVLVSLLDVVQTHVERTYVGRGGRLAVSNPYVSIIDRMDVDV